MTFRSKIDRFFISLILIYVAICFALFFSLFLFENDFVTIVIVTVIFFIILVFLLWLLLGIKYVFHEKYLFVKGGPFKSKIFYVNITKVTKTRDFLTGYKVLSSKDCIEIFYKTGLFGSVKISPGEKEQFLNELKKRCPNALFEL